MPIAELMAFTTAFYARTKLNSPMPGPDPSDTDRKFLYLVKSHEGGFATAPEIAPHTNVGEKQTRNRLDDLCEQNLLNSRKVGSTNVYWLSDGGEVKLAP